MSAQEIKKQLTQPITVGEIDDCVLLATAVCATALLVVVAAPFHEIGITSPTGGFTLDMYIATTLLVLACGIIHGARNTSKPK